MNTVPPLRVANFSGFLGDRLAAGRELVESAEVDVLTGDWLAELTMTILYKQRERDPLKGYAGTFLKQIEGILGVCAQRGIRIVSNAGGLNPRACGEAVAQLGQRLGLDVRVGVVEGDDILDRVPGLVAAGKLTALHSGGQLDLAGREPIVANAYLGAWGIADALERRAGVVVTGRVTDASMVVGSAAWRFGWKTDDWDRLAGAVVAGHVIECGAQATGGNLSFFREVPGREHLGFPIAELHEDGSSVITKPDGSGGAVTTDTVTAQLLYEVQSTRYLNPDVTVHLDSVRVDHDGPDRVRIHSVTGEAPTSTLKVSLAVPGGYRNAMTLALTGRLAREKAEVAERAIWHAVPEGREAFDEVRVELLGCPAEDPSTLEESYSLLRIAVSGQDEKLVGRGFSSAVIETSLASYPGFFTTTPPTPATAFALYRPALVPADEVSAAVTVDGRTTVVACTGAARGVVAPSAPEQQSPVGMLMRGGEPTVRVLLGDVFGARSGDKGGDANIGVWSRDQEAAAWLDRYLTPDLLRSLLPDAAELDVERYRLPHLGAVNFVLHGFLGDGVSSCLRFDPQAKGLAEYLLSRHVDLPARLVKENR